MWTPPVQWTLVFVSSIVTIGQRSLTFRLSIGLASMRQCSRFNFCELGDESDRERVHSGIEQVDRDLNLLEFAAIVSKA